jgi:hypothetical protein
MRGLLAPVMRLGQYRRFPVHTGGAGFAGLSAAHPCAASQALAAIGRCMALAAGGEGDLRQHCHPESFRFHQGQLMHIVLNTCMTGDTMMACAGFSLHQ